MNRSARRLVSCGPLLLIAFLVAGAGAGCRRAVSSETGSLPSGDAAPAGDAMSSDDGANSPHGIRIALVAPVFSPPAGDGRLVIRVADADDQPIDTAALQIRGDMTHAGMLPIEATAAQGEDGVYRIPVRWTMAGDWIITVEATLSDGRRATRSFDIAVMGEEELCIDGPQDGREE